MNMDLHHNVQAAVAIEAQTTAAASASISSGVIDLQSLGSPSAVEFICHVGELYSGAEFEFTITEGALSNGTDQAAPAAASILGSNPLTVSAADGIGQIGYVGNQRYVEITAQAVAGGSTSIVQATILAGFTRKPPTVTP